MKLRYLLIASFVIAASVPLFFALTYVNVDLANRYRQQKIEQLDGIATIAERRMDSALDRIEACTTMFINRQSVRDALAGLSGHDGEIDQATYQSIKAAIDEAAGSLADINGIFVLDASGNVVASTGVTGDLGRDHVVESDLIESMIYVNGPGIDLKLLPLNNSVGILSRYTLRNDAGQPCGHVAVLFDGAFIVDTVADRTGLGRTGEWLFAVANDDGSATFAVPLKYDKLAAFNRTIPANRPDIPIIQAIRGNETIMENAPDYRETPVIAATRYIDRQAWGLVAKIDQAEMLEPFRAAKFMLITLEVVLVTVSMLVGVILSHIIAHPVENLRDVTKTITSGDLKRRADIKGWGEVRDLSSSFNQMADSIVELTDGLNDTVEQRTAELAQANAELAEMATTDALTGLANTMKPRVSRRSEGF